MNTVPQIDHTISQALKLAKPQVQATLKLLQDKNTVPFIARYRKEATGSLDEDQIRDIQSLWESETALHARKSAVLVKIDEQGKLTPLLQRRIEQAKTLQAVEDLYLPYKEKKQTRAEVARKQGLEPLAEYLLSLPQGSKRDVLAEAQRYITTEDGAYAHTVASTTPETPKDNASAQAPPIPHAQAALQGAQDIIAEQSSEVPECRRWIRKVYAHNAFVASKVKKDGESLDPKRVYALYYNYSEPVKTIAPHRVLAIQRAEKEQVLNLKIAIDQETEGRIFSYLVKPVIGTKTDSPTAPYVEEALIDGFKRLAKGAIEREIRSQLKERAENGAIKVFSHNLQKLLLQPPLKGKTVLAIDPAFRTGCKMAVLDPLGKVLDIDLMYPHQKYPDEAVPQGRLQEAEEKVRAKVLQFDVNLIAIGNGTASRETEQFVSELITHNGLDMQYIIVNEAGASVYSASPLAKKEFPHLQVEERSAASIGRRVQDPLAELVKIDPKSLGVGQYQHDVAQSKLQIQLDFVVEKAVNQVGVDVNTASWALLQHVAGVSSALAEQIVAWRDQHGAFAARNELLQVPRFGEKTYEQAAGFLRIVDGENPLDKTAIHPESYGATMQLLQSLELTPEYIGTVSMREAVERATKTQTQRAELATQLGIGEITLTDICNALVAPLRDIRDSFPQPLLKTGVLKLEDLSVGMELQGTVRNVVDFGAFVDCGVKVNGLVHISRLKNGFVKHPKDVVSVGDIVTVWVLDIDIPRDRLALTMVPEV